jgi:hypothetical protein
VTGVVNRLLARATGRERSTLHLRRPARFERGPTRLGSREALPSEELDERAAAPLRAAEPEPSSGPRPVPRETGHASEGRPHRAPPAPAPETRPDAPPSANPGAPVATPPDPRANAVERLELPPASRAKARAMRRAAPGSTPAAEQATAASPAPPPPARPRDPPDAAAPLLDNRPGPSSDAPERHPLAASPRRMERAMSLDRAAPQPLPDLTIHIGRVDLRTEPPRPARVRTARPAPRLPSLADYLRGKER